MLGLLLAFGTDVALPPVAGLALFFLLLGYLPLAIGVGPLVVYTYARARYHNSHGLGRYIVGSAVVGLPMALVIGTVLVLILMLMSGPAG
jgi:hypothetical protein